MCLLSFLPTPTDHRECFVSADAKYLLIEGPLIIGIFSLLFEAFTLLFLLSGAEWIQLNELVGPSCLFIVWTHTKKHVLFAECQMPEPKRG